ncbi:hypothetical protein DERF_003534 [Dermatophagoides farinae]|uniref:Uncharacterized protein n=1 Tax=Dermatophagoides farinae TaxID=6954 RepID=A0A922IEW6_DERFA|nr:hypothetical protein DERF_003534 [Dermatophagoides farinae]
MYGHMDFLLTIVDDFDVAIFNNDGVDIVCIRSFRNEKLELNRLVMPRGPIPTRKFFLFDVTSSISQFVGRYLTLFNDRFGFGIRFICSK